jgi:hypothetical protein
LSTPSAAERSVDLIYRAAASGAACWARNHRGHVRELPVARWIGGLATSSQDRSPTNTCWHIVLGVPPSTWAAVPGVSPRHCTPGDWPAGRW